ncbi:MAG: hypothetical protein RLZZ292_2572, partial [Bacteroidota bacterium]
INGRTITTFQKALILGENQLQYDVSALCTGLYFIEMNTGQEQLTKRFIKN